MGRYKLGPQGGYYDPNDSGPDQFTPTPGQQYPGMPAPQQAPQGQPQQPPFGQYGYGSEGPGGITGHAQDPGWGGVHYGETGSQIGQGGGKQSPPGYHYGMDWTSGQLFPDNPNDPNTPPMQKHGEGWMGVNDAPMGGGGQSPWMTLGSLGAGQPWLESPAAGGSGRYDPMHPPPIADGYGRSGGGIFGSLGSLGGALGVNGGNVAPKPSGGIAGAIFNKYPDLFKR